MRFFSIPLAVIVLIWASIIPSVSANHLSRHRVPLTQSYTTLSVPLSCSFSSASVGIGTLPDGVIVTIDSPDYALGRCIQNTSWTPYFTRFGNNVSISASQTTRWVQILATSTDQMTASDLQNAQWSDIITGSNTYGTYGSTTYYQPQAPQYYYAQPSSPSYYYTQAPVYTPYVTTPYYAPVTTRTYTAGSAIFSTYQMYRALTYIPGGVKITMTSVEYNTMRYLQGYAFSALYRDLSGISTSISNISWGVEVTITSWNTSTIDQIQQIGYALAYR